MGSIWRTGLFLVKGASEFTSGGYDKAARSFDNSCMNANLKGKVVMVTGANQGVGYQIAQVLLDNCSMHDGADLAAHNCTLLMVCRNEEKGRDAVQEVIKASGNSCNQDVHLRLCDVSSLDSVRSLAAEHERSGRPLHVLVNNAGVLSSEGRSTSADGLELSFATNTLGAFHLTRLLEPVLRRSAPSRVVFMSSGGMYTEKLDVDDMQMERVGKYDGTKQYAKDKRRMVAYAEEFARRWQGSGIGSYSMHPGWTETVGARTAMGGLFDRMEGRIRSPAQGSDTATWLSMEDQEKLQSGSFYLDRKPQSKHLWGGGTQCTQQDVDTLWQSLSKLCGLAP